MLVLHQSHDQLILGADTRNVALLMVGGFILISIAIYFLLTSSQAFTPERIIPAALGIILFLSLFVGYYFYRVFGEIKYVFDKKTKMLTMQNISILGTKTDAVHLDHIDGVETRKIPTYAYNAHAGNAHDTYHTMHQDSFYSTVVLHFKGKAEYNLVPNAAYFFLHPFSGVTREVDNTLAQTVAKFLNVPLK
ncbi:MAG: hypothetical protein H0W89_01000 [Candidatus Levybacteria bacterium]|nr:hypothetical protein [Candidatus Levybacteria bacterium]